MRLTNICAYKMMGPFPIVLAWSMQVAKMFKMTSIGGEPDDSILLKVCNSSATQSPTVFALVWPSGIDCAHERNTTSSLYPWYVLDWSKGSLSSILCLPVASFVAIFFSLDTRLDAYRFHINMCTAN